MDSNFYDDLGNFDDVEAARLQKDSEIKAAKLDQLIHAVFAQNEKGAELVELWKQSLIMAATAEPGMDNIEIGIREGQKRFIKAILLTVKRVGES